MIKSLLVLAFGLLPLTAVGSPHYHGHRHHHHRHWAPPVHHWIVPAIVGGAVVYAATRPDQVIVQTNPVPLQPNQIVIDGITYTKQIMIINGVQQEVLVRQ